MRIVVDQASDIPSSPISAVSSRRMGVQIDCLDLATATTTIRSSIIDGPHKRLAEAQQAFDNAILFFFHHSAPSTPTLTAETDRWERGQGPASNATCSNFDDSPCTLLDNSRLDSAPLYFTVEESALELALVLCDEQSDLDDGDTFLDASTGEEDGVSDPLFSSNNLLCTDPLDKSLTIFLGRQTLWVNANDQLELSCLTDSSGAENSLPRATPRIHGVAQTLSRDMLQMIFEYLAGDTASILSILGTCRRWRSVAITISALFRGSAAWDVWPAYLLNSWTDWTRDQLVSVKLGGLALRRLSHEPRFLRVLKYGQQNWEHLDIEVLVPDDPAEARALQDNLQSLLSCSLPSLRTLKICWNDSIAQEAPILYVQPRHFLAIESLHLERVMLLFCALDQQGLDLSSLSCLSTIILHSIAARRQIWEPYLAALQRVPAFVRVSQCLAHNYQVALIQESVGGSALMLEDISFRGSKP